jgi:putative Mg2+ transporter-C (MgtC) family protein
MSLSGIDIAERLLVAVLVGGVLGIEREMRQKSAGLRTNMFIALGSATFTILSFEFADRAGADPARIAAQIVTGIGFLGAGAIMRTDQGGVHGLTTAALVWVNASLAMAAGAAQYRLVLIGTLMTALVLFGVPPLERLVDKLFWRKPPTPPSPPGAATRA